MTTVFEINGVFSEQSRPCTPDLGARFTPIPAKSRGCHGPSPLGQQQESCDLGTTKVNGITEQLGETPSGHPKSMLETVGFSLAVLVVIGLGTVGGWAVILVFNSLMQAQSLVVQNDFVFHR